MKNENESISGNLDRTLFNTNSKTRKKEKKKNDSETAHIHKHKKLAYIIRKG